MLSSSNVRFPFVASCFEFPNIIINNNELTSKILSGEIVESKFWMYFIGKYIHKIIYRPINKIKQIGCIPYSNRTFIRIDWSVQFCEQLGGKFGKTDSKNIDFTAKSLLANYLEIASNHCNKCWAYNFCDDCLSATIDSNGKFVHPQNLWEVSGTGKFPSV